MAIAYSTNLRNARLDAITTFAGGSCLLRIYDGSGRRRFWNRVGNWRG